jgi:hypothetical protein
MRCLGAGPYRSAHEHALRMARAAAQAARHYIETRRAPSGRRIAWE